MKRVFASFGTIRKSSMSARTFVTWLFSGLRKRPCFLCSSA